MPARLRQVAVNKRRRNALSAAAVACAAATNAVAAAGRAGGRAASSTAWVYDDVFLTPIFEDKHPEQPNRVAVIARMLRASPIAAQLVCLKPTKTEREIDAAIALLHTGRHVAALKSGYSEPVLRIARAGVAAALTGIDALLAAPPRRSTRNVFVCSRPPGHHARNTGREEGFCFFNNVSIAARYARQQYGVQRVLIVDWDYHHGDGTEHFFYNDGSVLLFNTYDPRAYPGSGDPARIGADAGLGLNLNVPLSCGAGDEAFVRVFEQQLVPAADAFAPQLILISAGFDSRIDDTLGCFRITDAGYVAMTNIVTSLAQRHCQGRVVSLLEGGYNLPGLASAALAHVGALLAANRVKA